MKLINDIYITAHEDAVFGFSEGKSSRINHDLGLMVMPKMFLQHLPVPLEVLKRELGELHKMCILLSKNQLI